jgi:hypothetical protein
MLGNPALAIVEELFPAAGAGPTRKQEGGAEIHRDLAVEDIDKVEDGLLAENGLVWEAFDAARGIMGWWLWEEGSGFIHESCDSDDRDEHVKAISSCRMLSY